jgi:hypothetical protein
MNGRNTICPYDSPNEYGAFPLRRFGYLNGDVSDWKHRVNGPEEAKQSQPGRTKPKAGSERKWRHVSVALSLFPVYFTEGGAVCRYTRKAALDFGPTWPDVAGKNLGSSRFAMRDGLFRFPMDKGKQRIAYNNILYGRAV